MDQEQEGIKTKNSQDIAADLSKNQAIFYAIISWGFNYFHSFYGWDQSFYASNYYRSSASLHIF